MDVLIINNHDYSHWIERKGLGWKRNDLDSSNAGRTLDGVMHRAKIGTKRTAAYTMLPMPRSVAAQLDNDLSPQTFTAKYLDLHGIQTRTFYCSSFSSTCDEIDERTNDSVWINTTFTMIEV